LLDISADCRVRKLLRSIGRSITKSLIHKILTLSHCITYIYVHNDLKLDRLHALFLIPQSSLSISNRQMCCVYVM